MQNAKPLHTPSSSPYALNGWWLFTGICLIYLFSAWWIQTEVLTDDIYYRTLGTKLSASKMDDFIGLQHRTRALGYTMIPLMLIVKMTATCFCLMTGLLVTGKRLPFRSLFKITLIAETAFVAAALLRLVLLAFFYTVDRLEDMQSFAPLSLYSLVKASAVPAWLVYPLQTINLFELGYGMLIAAGLHFFLRHPWKKMFLLTVCSYGLGLVCWMTVIVFLNLNLSPSS